MLKLYWHQGIIGLWIRFCNDIQSCITPRSSSFWFHWVSFPSVSCLTWSLWILPSNPLCVACYVWLRMSSFCLCLVSMSLSLFPCHSLSCSLSCSLAFSLPNYLLCVYIVSVFRHLMIPRDKTPIDSGLISRCTLTASWATTTGTGVCDLFSDTRASFSL